MCTRVPGPLRVSHREPLRVTRTEVSTWKGILPRAAAHSLGPSEAKRFIILVIMVDSKRSISWNSGGVCPAG